MRQAIIWTNADPIHWRIYASLGGDELIPEAMNYTVKFRQQNLDRMVSDSLL